MVRIADNPKHLPKKDPSRAGKAELSASGFSGSRFRHFVIILSRTNIDLSLQTPHSITSDLFKSDIMKFTIHILLLVLLAVLVLASAEQKPVVVSYPKDTPQSVLDAAMDAIKKAVRPSQMSLLDVRKH